MFLNSIIEAVSSCPNWRRLLGDILCFGHASETALPCGRTVNLKEPSPPPPDSPLSSATPTPPPQQTASGSASALPKKRSEYAGAPPGTTSKKVPLHLKKTFEYSSTEESEKEDEDELRKGEHLYFFYI
jgi:hypothetical protein